MAKICFIIMPFGADDAARRKFLGVYQSILKPAAESAGYSVRRADTEQMPGNITAEIINYLSTADMVIADLTGGNANVFFELGIRHVLRKSGTVHVVDRNERIPFDVQQYRVVEYSTHLADIPGVTEDIAEAIRRREDNSTRSDNPVHDTLTSLPADLRNIGEEAQLREIEELRTALREANLERESLGNRLAELDPAGSLTKQPSERDIDSMLDHAEEVMKSTGTYVMLRLQEIANEGGREAFVRELRSVVKSPYLSRNDFMGLSQMCRSLSLTDHRRVVMEIAHQRFPSTSEVFMGLIDAYDDSPAPAMQERGRLMLENYLHIVREGQSGLPRLPAGENPPVAGDRDNFDTAVSLLANFYFRANRPDWVKSAFESLKEAGHNTAAVDRNIANALGELGSEEAENAFREAVVHHDDSATHTFFGNYLNKRGRPREAYEQSEMAVIKSRARARPAAFYNHAAEILNHGYTRNAEGQIVQVDEEAALRSAIPIIVASIEQGDQSDREDAVNMLVRRNAIAEAQAIVQGNQLSGDYDAAVLNFILQRISERASSRISAS
jgi:Tfp pilus assembly protein PilF